MAATATKARRGGSSAPEQLTRDQAADRLLPLLAGEPQTQADLARQLGVSIRGSQSTVVHDALAVLEARHEAKKVPHKGRTGWVLFSSDLDAILPTPLAASFPPVRNVRCDEMFVPAYQRPLTSYYAEIKRDFNIYLFGNLVLSDRGASRNGSKRYALIDGQTRWKAASDIGVIEAPSIIHTGLTPEQEARLFVDIQRKRKGVTSWFAFRAELYAERMEVEGGREPGGDALAIVECAEGAGWEVGDGQGQIKSVAALRACFRKDEYLLQRALVDLKAAWPDMAPDAALIRGMHYLLRNYPIGERSTKGKGAVLDDQRLVRRLQTAGIRKVRAKADAAREMGSQTNEKAFGLGMQSIYQGA